MYGVNFNNPRKTSLNKTVQFGSSADSAFLVDMYIDIILTSPVHRKPVLLAGTSYSFPFIDQRPYVVHAGRDGKTVRLLSLDSDFYLELNTHHSPNYAIYHSRNSHYDTRDMQGV